MFEHFFEGELDISKFFDDFLLYIAHTELLQRKHRKFRLLTKKKQQKNLNVFLL